MVVVELIAIKGIASLSLHLKNQKRLRKEERRTMRKGETKRRCSSYDDDDEVEDMAEREEDDCTCVTSASTFAASVADLEMDGSSACSLLGDLDKIEQTQKHAHLDTGDGDDEDDCISICSLASTIETFAQRSNCSFRPHQSICLDDMEGDVLDSLDLSIHDVYDLTRRLRRGEEDDDLAVAIQAAILAKAISVSISRQATKPKAKRPTVQRQGSAKDFLQARADTFARNTRAVGGFVQARVDTFARNVETISLLISGESDDPDDPKQAEQFEEL